MSRCPGFVLLATLAAVGCTDRAPTGSGTRLRSPGDAVITGQVIGRSYYQLPGDTGSYIREEPLPGARIDARFRGTPAESDQGRDTMPWFGGSETADAQGRFTFVGLVGGEYDLMAYAPTDTLFGGWERIVVEAHDTVSVVIIVPRP